MKILALLTVKNEGAFLLEWLAHHRACGFTDVLVYSNDCADGTDLMLDRLQAMGWLTHVRNDGPHPEGPQWAALKAADKHPAKAAADWVMFLDVDEFVNIHVGDHTLSDLLATLPHADALPLTWRMFGNAGVVAFEDQPVTQTFTRAAPAVLHWPWRAALFKTLFRNNGTYAKLGVHRPRSLNKTAPPPRWVDGSGRNLGAAFVTTRIFSDFGQDNYQLAQLNHYPLGAMESYLVKCDRGRANREAATFDIGSWVERNFSAVEDTSIHALDSSSLRADLHADPVLGPLHKAAVAWRNARFTALMEEEPWRALFGRLLMAGPTRVLTKAEAQLIWRHASPGRPKISEG